MIAFGLRQGGEHQAHMLLPAFGDYPADCGDRARLTGERVDVGRNDLDSELFAQRMRDFSFHLAVTLQYLRNARQESSYAREVDQMLAYEASLLVVSAMCAYSWQPWDIREGCLSQTLISLIAGLIGAIIGAAGSVAVVLIQAWKEDKRHHRELAARLAGEDQRMHLEVARANGGGAVYLAHHLATLKALVV